MKITTGLFASLVLGIFLTIGTAGFAFAGTTTKVTKNNSEWVREAQEQAAEDRRAEEEANSAEAREAKLRQSVVDYALSFVGNRYVYGGADPNTGTDCSGFTGYVLRNAAGISVGRSSRDQAGEGKTISMAEIQPGDLLFYGKGSYVNHVAMYIGNGQIVHASGAKTGIKVSSWDYRSPIRIASFID